MCNREEPFILVWGNNEQGQLGQDTLGGYVPAPSYEVTRSTWRSVHAGGASTCGIQTDGTLWCWGVIARFLQPSSLPSKRPIQVGTATDWQTVSTSSHHACGMRSGSLWCFGASSAGQLGDNNGWSMIPMQALQRR